jgi:UDPglucose 6-dehydrogenase
MIVRGVHELSINSISVVGVGKLGLCMAVIFANKGYKVMGVDVDETKIELINKGITPFYEPRLDGMLKKAIEDLKFTATKYYEEAVKKTQATFVVVPTPSNEDGSYSNFFVEKALTEIGRAIKHKDEYHLVVVTSTVFPGTMDNVAKPLLEKVSGKKCGKDFGLCYNPEFIALGNVIEGLIKPDLVLIGQYDDHAGKLLQNIYEKVCENNPPIVRTSMLNAEIAKIALNSYVTMKISFANMLAEICERVPGADVDEVTKVLGLDSRIGSKYLKGGLGYGGPCFPRDNKAFCSFAKRYGVNAILAKATDEINVKVPERVVNTVLRLVTNKDAKIVILGLTYKPGTYVVEESQSLIIAKKLAEEGYKVIVHDPMGLDYSKTVLGDLVEYCYSLNECLEKGDVFILATPWNEYTHLKPEMFKRNIIFIDCWRLLKEKLGSSRVKYIALGIGRT